MRRTIISIFLVSLVFMSLGQRHLNFSYAIEAGVYQDDSLTYFIAHEYPVFQEHSNQEVLLSLAERFQRGFTQDSFADTSRFKTLVALSIQDDALLDAEGLLEMLRNQLGMSKAEFSATPHKVEMHLHSIRFPNHQESFFNHDYWYAIRRNGMKGFIDQQTRIAMDWETGKPLTLATLGGASSQECLINAIEALNWDACTGKELEKQLESLSYCNWMIERIETEYVKLSLSSSGLDCNEDEHQLLLDLSRSCLKGNGMCGE